MNTLAKLALVGAVTAFTPRAAHAQAIGGISNTPDGCHTVAIARGTGVHRICITNQRDTVIAENDYFLHAKTYTERDVATNKTHRVLALQPFMYSGKDSVSVRKLLIELVDGKTAEGYILRFISAKKE